MLSVPRTSNDFSIFMRLTLSTILNSVNKETWILSPISFLLVKCSKADNNSKADRTYGWWLTRVSGSGSQIICDPFRRPIPKPTVSCWIQNKYIGKFRCKTVINGDGEVSRGLSGSVLRSLFICMQKSIALSSSDAVEKPTYHLHFNLYQTTYIHYFIQWFKSISFTHS